MKASRSRLTAIGFTALALIVVAGSFAWACTTQANLQIIPPAFGPAGTQVPVTGGTGVSGVVPVELRWNSPDGPLLATVQSLATQDGVFHAQVTIPAVSPDVYYLVAVVQGQGVARAAYEVTGAADSSEQTPATGTRPAKGVASDLWSGLSASTGASSAQSGAALSQAPASKGRVAGMAFLALGAMALTGGAVLAFGRKRTAQASR